MKFTSKGTINRGNGFEFCKINIKQQQISICIKNRCEDYINIWFFLDRAFSIMRTKINQQNAQINSGLIYY